MLIVRDKDREKAENFKKENNHDFVIENEPEEMADLSYLASTCECSHLLNALKGKEMFDPVYHTATMKEVREEMK